MSTNRAGGSAHLGAVTSDGPSQAERVPDAVTAVVEDRSPAERFEFGKAARREVLRSRLGEWEPAPERDPIELL